MKTDPGVHSSGFKACGTSGLKYLRGTCLKTFINQFILQVISRQNYNASNFDLWQLMNPLSVFFTLVSCT